MPFDKPVIQTSNPYKQTSGHVDVTRTIYYGEVVVIDDPTDGGRIKVKIPGLDNQTGNAELPWCYPVVAKFFHAYPKVGEMVRVFIEDIKYPQRSRFWAGPIISQPQKIEYDSIYTALSTTNMALTNPEPAPSTYPDAVGVFPLREDIAIVGRVNADIILKVNEVHLRAGQHENDNILKLNTVNPATISMIYESKKSETSFYSNTLVMSDKIGLISHTGNPQFKAARLTPADRVKIFEDGHPIPRGDVLVEALKIIRTALVEHIHGYSNLPADKAGIINALEGIDFDNILQKNIVIN
jgi:hypothetical protein